MCVCVRVCACACVRVRVCACGWACARARARVRVRVSVCACVWVSTFGYSRPKTALFFCFRFPFNPTEAGLPSKKQATRNQFDLSEGSSLGHAASHAEAKRPSRTASGWWITKSGPSATIFKSWSVSSTATCAAWPWP